MRVGFNTISPMNFGAKSKEIRRADDMQRKARLAFPVLSPTYIDEFYLSGKYNSPSSGRVCEISNNMQYKIEAMREASKYPDYYLPNVPDKEKNTLHAILLNCLEDLQAGNCDECAKASLATLYANGYFNSERVNLLYKVELINKETGEIAYSMPGTLNHCLVLTDMNNGGDKNIVVDSWLGFADSIEGATARFKAMCKKDIEEYLTSFPRYFMYSRLAKGEECSLDDYDVKGSFLFMPADKNVTEAQKEGLSEYMKVMYDKVLVDKD